MYIFLTKLFGGCYLTVASVSPAISCVSLQFSTVHLNQLKETIKGRKCEIHVSSVLGKCIHTKCCVV